MIVIPAIDLKDHQVVRLKQGRMDDSTSYSADITDMATQWVDQGATRLHLVDLNGAFEGRPIHFKDVEAIAERHPELEIEVGGGIRSEQTLSDYFNAGVTYCILGTVAIKNPELVRKVAKQYQGKIIVGIDAKDGQVAIEGWDQASQVEAFSLAKSFEDLELESIIYTDIAKDGMLSGMNVKQTQCMKSCGTKIIASGGLTSLNDIDELKALGGIHGVIAGKAIYEDRFSLSEAIARAK